MKALGLLLGLLTAASTVAAEQPEVHRDLTETAAPFAWLPGDAGISGSGIPIRRGLVPLPPVQETVAARTPTRAESARARIERDRALRLLRDTRRREVVFVFTDKHVHPPKDVPEPEPETVRFFELAR